MSVDIESVLDEACARSPEVRDDAREMLLGLLNSGWQLSRGEIVPDQGEPLKWRSSFSARLAEGVYVTVYKLDDEPVTQHVLNPSRRFWYDRYGQDGSLLQRHRDHNNVSSKEQCLSLYRNDDGSWNFEDGGNSMQNRNTVDRNRSGSSQSFFFHTFDSVMEVVPDEELEQMRRMT